MSTRHIVPGLFAGWDITNDEGQHTAYVAGSRQEALDRAHHQLDVLGGGRITIEEQDN